MRLLQNLIQQVLWFYASQSGKNSQRFSLFQKLTKIVLFLENWLGIVVFLQKIPKSLSFSSKLFKILACWAQIVKKVIFFSIISIKFCLLLKLPVLLFTKNWQKLSLKKIPKSAPFSGKLSKNRAFLSEIAKKSFSWC